MPKGVLYGQLALGIAAVAHKHTLTVIGVVPFPGKVRVGGCVLIAQREGYRQSASRLCLPGQQPCCSHTTHTARNKDTKNRVSVWQPVPQLYRAGDVQQHYGFQSLFFCLFQHLGHAVSVLFLYRHTFPVYIFTGGSRCCVHQRVSIGPLLKIRCAAYFSVFLQHIAVQIGFYCCRTGTTFQCIAAARTPEYRSCILGQRKCVVFIFEQYRTIFNRFASGFQNGIRIIFSCHSALILFNFYNQLQNMGNAVIQRFFRQYPLYYGLFASCHIVWTRLNQIHTGRQRTGFVLPGCAPVTYNRPIKVQFSSQQIRQQLFAVGGKLAVHCIIGTHNTADVSLLDSCRKATGVKLHHRPFGQIRTGCIAVRFLIIGKEMLGTGRNSRTLHTTHKRRGSLCHKFRVLAVHFVVAPTQRVPRNIHIRAKADIYTCISQFLSDRFTDFFCTCRVKCRTDIDTGREADMLPTARTVFCRLLHKSTHQGIVFIGFCRLFKIQTVQCYHLGCGIGRSGIICTARICQIVQHNVTAVQTGCAVHQINGRNVHIRDRPRMAGTITADHIQLFLQCHIRHHLGNTLQSTQFCTHTVSSCFLICYPQYKQQPAFCIVFSALPL